MLINLFIDLLTNLEIECVVLYATITVNYLSIAVRLGYVRLGYIMYGYDRLRKAVYILSIIYGYRAWHSRHNEHLFSFARG